MLLFKHKFSVFSLLFHLTSTAISSHSHSHGHHHKKLLSRSKTFLDADARRSVDFIESSHVEPNALLSRQDTPGGQIGGSSSTSSSGDYTCGPGKPCGNGACCGADGWCGYSPKYCGVGCQSNCDAKAECGKYAKKPGQGCPLNVCCSEHGFCGTMPDFCGSGCQSNCKQPKPKNAPSDPRRIVVGYYEGWNMKKKCGSMKPEEIPIGSLTHLIFSFGFISPGTFRIENMADYQPSLFGRVTDLKQKKPSLKVLIALGGWTHNDPGKYQKVFSDMASTAANRKKFINNVLGFITQYGFDGVDIDWEYPGAEDRGGISEDGANLTLLLKEMKKVFGQRYLLTFTVPTSYWYLRHFDLKKSVDAADWVNLMSYDLHGVWDRDNPIGNRILGHTNLTEIDDALNLFWRNNVPPSKIVMGTGFYGRTFRLQDPSCWTPGCLFSGPGEKGPCTDTEGFLSYKEVKDILAKSKAKPKLDKKAGVQYVMYGQNSWISFDDPKTIEMKVDFAGKRGLKGVMTWAIDIDNEKGDLLRALSGKELKDTDDLLQFMTDDGPSIAHGTSDATKCYVSDCGKDDQRPSCKDGYTAVGRANTDIEGKNRCNTGRANEARMICCPSFAGPQVDECRWHDERSNAAHTDCSAKCDVGEINVVNDSFGWTGGVYNGSYGDQCGRGWKSFCCKAGNMKRYLDICTWTGCGEQCPSDKPHELTTDTGGPSGNDRCDWESSGDPFSGEGTGFRRLCCPKEDSFKNCNWESSKVCSSTCGLGKITLDLDPRGPDPRFSSCHNGRQQAFCCEPPGGLDHPFAPYNLTNLFPSDLLPPADSIPHYDLVSFGGVYTKFKVEDPKLSGVAFFLVAGSSSAVSSMTKRDNPGLEFIDCPENILDRPDHELQTARIICMHANVTDCFKVQENGVEGTIVRMPETCGGPSWSRAVSLSRSANQTIPQQLANRNPTSDVYEFVFDYNIALVRRDSGRLSIRLDYSNVPGYWNTVVDSPPKKKREAQGLVDRWFDSGNGDDWYAKFNELSFHSENAVSISEKLNHLVYHDGQQCRYEDSEPNKPDVAESISIAMQGNASVGLHYGFSMIATWEPGSKMKIHQSAGFVRPEGLTDLTLKMGGTGVLNTAKSLHGSTLSQKISGPSGVAGHSVFKGWAYFTAYKEVDVSLRSANGNSGGVPFSGYVEARVKADWGRYNVHFPGGATSSPEVGNGDGSREEDTISKSTSRLAPVEKTPNGMIEVGTTVKLGLQIGMSFAKPWQFDVGGDLPNMAVSQFNFARWTFENTGQKSCVATSLGSEMRSILADGAYSGWSMDKPTKAYVQELSAIGDKECFTKNGADRSKRSIYGTVADKISRAMNLTTRSGENPITRGDLPGDPIDFGDIPLPGNNLGDLGWNNMQPRLRCDGCGSCTLENALKTPCCGCVCLDCKYGPMSDSNSDENIWTITSTGEVVRDLTGQNALSRAKEKSNTISVLRNTVETLNSTIDTKDTKMHSLEERDNKPPSSPPKSITACGQSSTFRYPAYPNYHKFPSSTVDFHNHPKSAPVMKYFYNSSSSCLSWGVARFPLPQMIYGQGKGSDTAMKWRKETYQTEHPFEAQIISNFLQGPVQQLRGCQWITQHLINDANPWPNALGTVMDMLASQLGGQKATNRNGGFVWDRRERLATFHSSPNFMKGQLFTGNAFNIMTYFGDKQPGDEQIQRAKEFGMIFTYMNHPDIWGSFCDSFNGVVITLRRFEQEWNTNNPHDNIALVALWQRWVRSEISRVVQLGRESAMSMYNDRKPVGGAFGVWWTVKWWTVYKAPLINQYGYIKLDRPCANLQ